MELYSIEQIKKYITSQDSLGDVLYNLNEENINKVNTTTDISDNGDCPHCGSEDVMHDLDNLGSGYCYNCEKEFKIKK